jgi:excisionase family DNA binding protein
MGQQALTVKEIAEALRVTPEAVRAWMRAGELPAFQLPSGDWRAWPADVEVMIARGRQREPQGEGR